MVEKFDAALSPTSVGPVRLRNRIVSTAHQTGLVHDNLPTTDLVAYHEERARGGIGAIFLEASAVHPTGLLTPHTIAAYRPEAVGPLGRISDAVHEHGAAMFVQLFHAGREQIATAPKRPALAPSPVPSTRFHVEPRALTRREIADMVVGYGRAARHLTDAGFDGIEISAAHSYLPAQFFASRSNRRSDDYNGDLSARLRFLVEALTAVRRGMADGSALGVRLALDEVSPGGLDSSHCLEIATTLCSQVPLDFVSFALGDSATHQGSAFIAPPPPVPANHVLSRLDGLRSALPAHTSMLSTTRVVDLAAADAAISAGLTDLVGMTRAHIAEPHLVRKATEGRPAIPCIGCNVGCIGHYHAGLPIACVTNVSSGREAVRGQRPDERASDSGSSVLVVGAGPAGVAAAIEAAENGDTVTLVDRSDTIGGQLRLSGVAPGHAETWERWRDWSSCELERLSVTVRLETVATTADTHGHDRVVIATGAVPFVDDEGDRADTTPTIVDGWPVLADPSIVRGPVLVADWGGDPTGLDVAEVLAARGLPVQLAYAAPIPGEHLHQYQRNGYLGRLDELGVRLIPHSELVLTDGSFSMRNIFSGRLSPLPPDIATIVRTQGRVPVTELWEALEGDPRVSLVGDAAGPRGLEEATLEGTLAVTRPRTREATPG